MATSSTTYPKRSQASREQAARHLPARAPPHFGWPADGDGWFHAFVPFRTYKLYAISHTLFAEPTIPPSRGRWFWMSGSICRCSRRCGGWRRTEGYGLQDGRDNWCVR